MHSHWDFDASNAQTQRVSALDKHQNWSTSALFCHNFQAESKYAVINLIHTWLTPFCLLLCDVIRHFNKFKKSLNITTKIQLPGNKWINSMLAWINIMWRWHSCSRQHCTRCPECNCTKIIYANYFHLFWVTSIQIGCSMHVVYTEYEYSMNSCELTSLYAFLMLVTWMHNNFVWAHYFKHIIYTAASNNSCQAFY